MKIGRLKRRADELAADALSDRLEYKSHAERALVIARGNVGSPAGLAISFSLGFMTGTASGRTDGAEGNLRNGAGRQRRHPAFIHQLAHGPVGEAAMKLGMALLARSLLKLQEDAIGGAPREAHTSDTGGVADIS